MHGLTLETVIRMVGGEMQFLRCRAAGRVKRHVDGLYYMVDKAPSRQSRTEYLEHVVEACAEHDPDSTLIVP
jgi:hypothetical protein